MVVLLKAAALLHRLVVGRCWRSERCCVKGSPASVGMLPVNSKWQSDLTEKCCSSRTCLCVWSSVIALLYLCHCGVYFMEGVPSAALCVQLPKTHLHKIRLCQACCLGFAPVWVCLKKVTEIKVLELFERCSLPV